MNYRKLHIAMWDEIACELKNEENKYLYCVAIIVVSAKERIVKRLINNNVIEFKPITNCFACAECMDCKKCKIAKKCGRCGDENSLYKKLILTEDFEKAIQYAIEIRDGWEE